MYNFYEYLNISNTAEVLDIILAYKNKILSYNQCDIFTERQMYEIKMLKIALYILTNKNLRGKYDKLLILKSKKEDTSKNSIDIDTVNSKALLSNLNIETTGLCPVVKPNKLGETTSKGLLTNESLLTKASLLPETSRNQNINTYENKSISDINHIELDSQAPQELSKQQSFLDNSYSNKLVDISKQNDNILSTKNSSTDNNVIQTDTNTERGINAKNKALIDNKNHSTQLKSNNNEDIYENNLIDMNKAFEENSNFLEFESKNQVESLDNLFEIDNSWMKNINDINSNGYLGRKKNQLESHSIMDRIFSIPIQTNKKYPNNLN